MTKSELQGLLNRINSITVSSPESINEYCSLLKLCIEKLQSLKQEDKNPLLDAWLGMGLQEIRKELNERFSESFNSLSDEKKKTELLYSRSMVTMTLTNILIHL
jgi:hypothetical protein